MYNLYIYKVQFTKYYRYFVNGKLYLNLQIRSDIRTEIFLLELNLLGSLE